MRFNHKQHNFLNEEPTSFPEKQGRAKILSFVETDDRVIKILINANHRTLSKVNGLCLETDQI